MADSKEGSVVVDAAPTKSADRAILTKQEEGLMVVLETFVLVIAGFWFLKMLEVIPKCSLILDVVSLCGVIGIAIFGTVMVTLVIAGKDKEYRRLSDTMSFVMLGGSVGACTVNLIA